MSARGERRGIIINEDGEEGFPRARDFMEGHDIKAEEVITDVLVDYIGAMGKTGVHDVELDTFFASQPIMNKKLWKQIEASRNGRGHVLATGREFPPNASLLNAIATMEAVELGRYQLISEAQWPGQAVERAAPAKLTKESRPGPLLVVDLRHDQNFQRSDRAESDPIFPRDRNPRKCCTPAAAQTHSSKC